MKSEASAKAFTSAGFLSAFAASLCCITPVIALVAASSSVAANFSWLEPARPYLIAISVAVLLLAWYQKLKPVSKAGDCNCEPISKTTFLQSKNLSWHHYYFCNYDDNFSFVCENVLSQTKSAISKCCNYK